MNKSAETHLATAKEYVAKGETFYRKAAEEIVAAQKADPTLTLREVDRKIGWYAGKAGHIVRWITSGAYTEQALPRSEPEGAVAQRHARSVLREAPPERIAEMLSDPKISRKVSEAQQIVARAQAEVPRHIEQPRPDPSFIALVVRINSALIELETVVGSWENPSAIPSEFSAASFDDIAEKAMRIKDHVNALRSADNDEFQNIVRNFRVVSSGA